jgi:hypothetical protein
MVDRNFKENPITAAELLECRWYPVEDNMIGGYAVCTVDKPTGDIDYYNNEFEVAYCTTQAVAEHVADLHNNWWNRTVWMSYFDNIEYTLDHDLTEPGD